MTNQQYQDPFVAIVVRPSMAKRERRRSLLTLLLQIDPNRTISAGRVDIGAFRTFPADYKPPNAGPSEYQTIPLNKIEDFGAHASSYYPLKVEHFKSSLDTQLLDMLWNKYWASTLAQSPVVVNRSYTVGQLDDLAEKLRRSQPNVGKRGTAITSSGNAADKETTMANGEKETKEQRVDQLISDMSNREAEAPLSKAASDGNKISMEAHNGLISQVLKDALFNRSATGAVMPAPL